MARARNIKPGFFKNEELVGLPFEYRLLFIGLWTLADREGRLEDRPKRIRMELFPADDVDCDVGLQALEASGLVRRYQVEGNAYIDIPTFGSHQNPHQREAASVIPACPAGHSRPAKNNQGTTKAQPRLDQGTAKARASRADSLNPDSKPETTPALPTRTTPPEQPAAGAVVPEPTPPDPEPPAQTPPEPWPIPKAPLPDGLRKAVEGLSLDQLRAGLPVGTDDHALAGVLHAICAANNVRAAASHPQIVEWARAGVTKDLLIRAIVEARKVRDDQLNPAYLAPIVERILAQGFQPKAAGDWMRDEKACEAKARELGLWPPPAGKGWDELRASIRQKLARRAEETVRGNA